MSTIYSYFITPYISKWNGSLHVAILAVLIVTVPHDIDFLATFSPVSMTESPIYQGIPCLFSILHIADQPLTALKIHIFPQESTVQWASIPHLFSLYISNPIPTGFVQMNHDVSLMILWVLSGYRSVLFHTHPYLYHVWCDPSLLERLFQSWDVDSRSPGERGDDLLEHCLSSRDHVELNTGRWMTWSFECVVDAVFQ